MKYWLRAQVIEFYEEGICRLAKRYDKCLNLNVNYVEKYLKAVVLIYTQ